MRSVSIPPELGGLSFCLVKAKEKVPFEKGWQNKPYTHDDPKLQQHLQAGGNYGVVCGYSDLMVLDVDDVATLAEVVDLTQIPPTFAVKTGGGGFHFYLKVTGGDHQKIVLKDSNGAHLGELQGAGTMVVGPGSVHPSGAAYTVHNDAVVAEISRRTLVEILSGAIPEEKLKKAGTRRRAPTSVDDDPFGGVSILDVIDTTGFAEEGGRLSGPHPMHGSSTGHNLVIDPVKNVWWCGRHETGGSVSQWLAVEAGLVDCADMKPGAVTGKVFLDVMEYAVEKGLIQGWGSVEEKATAITEEELATIKADVGPKFELNLPGNHYLTRYIAYGRDVSDAYPDYWFAGGLYQLAVIADKKIWVKLRQGPVYPNLYIFMAGRSSLSRKSTVVDTTESLLNDHRPGTAINAVPTEFSPEAFIEHLDESPHAPWVRDEAAGVLSTMRRDYMRGFKDSLMQLYDCRPIHRKLRTNRRSKSKTDFVVDDPYLNVLWATTDSSLAANTEINDTLSGFMARFIYHFPRRPKERWLPLEEGEAMNSELELVVGGQLSAMSKTASEMVRHQLKFSPEAAEYWTRWQKQRATEIEGRDDANEMQIHSRLVPLVAKLAMLFELGSSDFDPAWRRPIRLEYVVEACRLVDEYYQPMAMAVYDMVGRDLEKNVIDRIIAFLKRHGGVSTKREISRHVKIKARELQEYLDTMAGDGTVEYCEVTNPQGPATTKVVLNVDTVYTVDKVTTVNTVTRNTEDREDERNTGYEESYSPRGEGVTDEGRKLGDSEDTGDRGDSSDSLTVCPLPRPPSPNAETPTDDGRIFGMSIPYYLDLGGGQLPTVTALATDQGWPKDKAVMAIGLLKARGLS